MRTDGAGGTKETIEFLTHRRVSYSAGFTLPDHTPQIHEHHPREPPGPRPTTLTASPDRVQTSLRPADLLNLTAWPDGMRLNRAPRPAPPGHPAALRGHRRLSAHRLHHQHKSGSARRPQGPPPTTSPLPGNRIDCAKDTRLNHFPLQGIAQNHIWSLNVTLTCNLPAFSQLLTPTSTPARAWKPRTIHLRLISIPATTAHHTRRTILHYKTDHPWTDLLLTGLEHLQAPPAP